MLAREVAEAAQLACLLEASAPKPGNVSPGRHFADVRYEHFLASAVAIGEPLAGAGHRPLGETIRLAIEATAHWAPSNTNLGIVLLLAPLARAAIGVGVGSERGQSGVRPQGGLRASLRMVLETTTVDDAREVYAAIRLANPGGLGRADSQDVANEPTVTLLEAMRLATGRDGIAREYATAFATTFDVGAPALRNARCGGLSWDDAVVETFLTVLAAAPDTHIARRAGEGIADEVTRTARAALDAGGVRSVEGRRALAEMDASMRDPHNSANPGTSADLTAAAIFLELLDGGLASHGSR
jgi:triphosphoribosyl-dephospho-CoA synthase